MRLTLIFLLVGACAQAQFRGHNWVVPDSAGIDFTTNPPSVFFSKVSAYGNYPLVNVSCISDNDGHLLCYTNGKKIFDASNDTMPNGSGLANSVNNYSGSLILPFPEKDSLYVMFHTWFANFNFATGLYYTVINMDKRAGLGDVDSTQKNVLVSGSQVSMQLVAIKHANGRDWWILCKSVGFNDYSTLLLNPSGVQVIGSQSAGFFLDSWSLGEMCTSIQGNRVAFAMWYPTPLDSILPSSSVIEVLDFDRCTGILSNPQFLHSDVAYPVAFSPNGKLLYYATFDSVYQVAGLDGSQPISKTAVGSHPYYDPSTSASLDSSYSFSEMELAPDGRIYFPLSKHVYPNNVYASENMSLCTIDSPDVQGLGCNFQLNSFYLGGKRSSWGLPNMPNYNLGRLIGSPCDTLYNALVDISEPSFAIHPNPGSDYVDCSFSESITHQAVLEIRDALGRLVLRQKVSNGFARVSTKALSAGVYNVSLLSKNERVGVQRWVKTD